MNAVTQVGAGTGAQSAVGAAPRAGKETADFRESMEKLVGSVHGAGKAAEHAKGGKEKDSAPAGSGEPAGEKDAAVAGKSAPMLADAVDAASAVANVVVLPVAPSMQKLMGSESTCVMPAAASVKKVSAPQGAKSVASGGKDGSQTTAAKGNAADTLRGQAGKAIEPVNSTAGVVGSGSMTPAGKDAQQVAPALTIDRAGATGEAKSSLRVPLENASLSHAGAAPAEVVHTLQVAPNVLEVGLASTTHGWLRVRAELGATGDVSAQVVAASAGAAENLHKELPMLNAYLASEQVGVSSLTVNAMERGAGAQDAAMHFDGGQGSGAEREAQGRGRDEGVFAMDEMPGSLMTAGFGFLPAAMMAGGVAGSGGWLSVRV